ncbi:MAG: beta-lactamase family protein [Bacteroidales bacterium]|nr:beta-lactamase family protein [Bacteroidales bacterium]
MRVIFKLNKIAFIISLPIAVLIFTSFIGESIERKDSFLDNLVKNLPSPHLAFIEEYGNYILSQVDSTKTVGAALAVVSHDSLLFMKTYGVRIAGTADSVDFNTKFRLASVSKGFAGVLACILQEEGILNLDEKIIETVPGFHLKSAENTVQLTLKHTLNHSTGIEAHAFDGMAGDGAPYSRIVDQLKQANIAGKPGDIYSYQNAIFSLIDTVLRAKTYCTYSELLYEKIFYPLGMNDASVDFEAMKTNRNVAYPHQMVNGRYTTIKLNSGYYNVAPAAGVNASISDMAKWLKALMGGAPNVIDTTVRRNIETPLIYTPLKRQYTKHWGKVDEKYYSLGWRVYKYNGHTIVYHGGFVRGYRAEIAYCPELKTGMVFLQNSPNALAGKVVPEFWKMFAKHFPPDSSTMELQN